MDFSRFQHHHHADSLVPILCSLDQWTPFYWGQSRLGMVVPLLARPISSPLANLLFQVGLNIALGFCAFALLARYLLREDRDWVLPAAISLALFIAFAGENERFDVFSTSQPYSASMALGLAGLWLIRAGPTRHFAWRIAGAAVLLALAEWINVGAFLILGPLAVTRLIFDARAHPAGWRNALPGLLAIALLLILTAASRTAGMFLSGSNAEPGAWAPVGEWLARERTWMAEVWRQLSPHRWEVWALGMAALGVASLLFPIFRRAANPRLLAATGLAAVALLNFFGTGLVDWVQTNGFAVRYGLPAMLVLAAALGQLAAIPLEAIDALGGALGRTVAALAVTATVAASYGFPGSGHVEHAFDSPWHPWDVSWTTAAREVISTDATHVTGNYWEVWPVVFRAEWLRHEEGRPRPLFGLADRSGPTLASARAVPFEQTRVAVVHGRGGSLAYGASLLGYSDWERVERRSLIEVFRPRR